MDENKFEALRSIECLTYILRSSVSLIGLLAFEIIVSAFEPISKAVRVGSGPSKGRLYFWNLKTFEDDQDTFEELSGIQGHMASMSRACNGSRLEVSMSNFVG